MRLTLKSLQTEMHSSFAEVNARIDRLDQKLDYNVGALHDRVDSISLSLDKHIKETKASFREVDQRFDAIDQRFDAIDQRFNAIDRRFDKMTQDILDAFLPYSNSLDETYRDHDQRIRALESRY